MTPDFWSNVLQGLIGSLIGGITTLVAAWYTLKEQAKHDRTIRLNDAQAERAIRQHEKRQAQAAFDRNATRLFRAQVIGLSHAEFPAMMYDHLRELRRMMIEHTELFLEIHEANQEFYAHHLAGLPHESSKTMAVHVINAKRDVHVLKFPDIPTS
jgi:hypothetical protein